MTLFEEFLSASGGAAGCKLARHMENLGQSDQQAVQKALKHEAVTATAISEVLGGHGYQVSPDVVQRHRRHACSCFKRGRVTELVSVPETGVAQ